MQPVRFDGRVAVVTGAGRGLGREFAHLLAARGAAVVVNDIGASSDAERYGSQEVDRLKDADPADSVVEEIIAAGGMAVSSHADVTDSDQVFQMVDSAIRELGRIDIIINNAGIVITGTFDELTSDIFSKCFDVHVRGSFNVSSAAWHHMTGQNYGRILNVCSVDGVVVGNLGHAAYDAAKGGLAGLTRAMSTEAAGSGILVNGILPGAITRAQASTDPALSPTSAIDMSPSLVAPGACWLIHEDCCETGRFFSCSSGRMGLVFVGVAEGYQAIPSDFTLENVRQNWPLVMSSAPFVSPRTTADYNDFRTESFQRRLSAEASK